jgi:hypothetical protein
MHMIDLVERKVTRHHRATAPRRSAGSNHLGRRRCGAEPSSRVASLLPEIPEEGGIPQEITKSQNYPLSMIHKNYSNL